MTEFLFGEFDDGRQYREMAPWPELSPGEFASEPAGDQDDPIEPWALEFAQRFDPETRIEQHVECMIYNHFLGEEGPGDGYSVGNIQANDEIAAALETIMSDADIVLAEIAFGVWLYCYGQKEN